MERERVTEIWVDGHRRNGSGYLLADRLVLTCWHVVEGVALGDQVKVRPLGRPASAAKLSASVRWFLPGVSRDVIENEPWLDAALLEIDDQGWLPARPYAPVRFGRVPAEDRVACRGSGFPDAEQRRNPKTGKNVRDTLPVHGLVDPLHAAKSGMLTIRADKGTELEHSTEWRGGSGTALFCDSLLIGVLALVRPHDPGVLIAVPVTALEDLPDFRDTLRTHGIRLRFEDASDPRRGENLREYMTAVGRAAHDHPYPGVLGAVPPLAAVYFRQHARQEPAPEGDRAAGDAVPPSATMVSADKVLAVPGTCVVTGGPGGGKSSLLRTWTTGLADRQLQDLQPDGTTMWAPVLVQAAAVAEHLRERGSLPLPDALAEAAVAQVPGFQLSVPKMAALLSAAPMLDSRWLVMIDALDEVTADDDRRGLLTAVAGYTADNPHLYRFIIATRPAPESELAHLGRDKTVFDLQPFQPENLPTVIRDWFTALAVPNPDESATAFLTAVHRAGLGGLASVPLITAMLCQLYARDPGRPLPGSRGAVYGRFTGYLHKHRDTPGPGGLRFQTKTDMARHGDTAVERADRLLDDLPGLIAYLAAERWRGNTARALDIVTAHPSAGPPPGFPDADDWRSFLDSSLRRSGLLTAMGDDLVFLHQTFLEYLAAQHAARAPETLASALHEVTGQTARYRPGAVDMTAPRRPGRRYWVPPPPEADSYAGFLIDLAQAAPPPIERCGILFSEPGLIRTREGADFLIALMDLGTELPDRLRQQTADLLHALAPAHTLDFRRRRSLLSYWMMRAVGYLTRNPALRVATSHRFIFLDRGTSESLDQDARMRVIRGLIELGDQRGADHLYNGARFLRIVIFQEKEARELARLGDPRGAELLAGFAGDPDFFDGSRVTAARDLAELGDPRGTDFLFTLANDVSLDDVGGSYSRVRAAQDLAQLGDPRGAELLRSFVFRFKEHPHFPRVEAARRLAELGDPGAADTWYALAAYDVYRQHGMSRVDAARELAKLGDPRTASAWLAIASTSGLHDDSRVEAAHELTKLDDPLAVDAWRVLALDPERDSSRVAAARELAKLGDPRVADTWRVLAHDLRLRPGSRVIAAEELVRLRDPRAADTSHALAHDPDLADGWRIAAARGLTELGDLRAASTWHALAHDPGLHPDSQASAAEELAKLRNIGRVTGSALTLTSQGDVLMITASEDGMMRLWRAADDSLELVGEPQEGHPIGFWVKVAVGQLGDKLVAVTGGTDGSVRLWRVTSDGLVQSGDPQRNAGTESLAVGQLGDHLVALTGGPSAAVELWRVHDERPVLAGNPQFHGGYWVGAVTFAQLSGYPVAITGAAEGSVRLWRVSDDGLAPAGDPHPDCFGDVRTVAAGQAGSHLIAITGNSSGSVQLWRVRDDGLSPSGDPRPGHTR